jgi:uncharacterized phiE125 gp8 family phage protein
MNNTIIQQPLIEPVTLDEVKTYLRVDTHQENPLLEQLIKSARRMIEDYTGRALITQVHRVISSLDVQGCLTLPMAPFQELADLPELIEGKRVEKICNYRLDKTRPQARVFINHRLADEINVQIDYRCGYGDKADSVPDPLRQGILLLVADLYENRPGEAIGKRGTPVLPGLVRALADPYRILPLI